MRQEGLRAVARPRGSVIGAPVPPGFSLTPAPLSLPVPGERSSQRAHCPLLPPSRRFAAVPAGFYAPNGQTPVACPKGTYSNQARPAITASSCTPCNPGTTTQGLQAETAAACNRECAPASVPAQLCLWMQPPPLRACLRPQAPAHPVEGPGLLVCPAELDAGWGVVAGQPQRCGPDTFSPGGPLESTFCRVRGAAAVAAAVRCCLRRPLLQHNVRCLLRARAAAVCCCLHATAAALLQCMA